VGVFISVPLLVKAIFRPVSQGLFFVQGGFVVAVTLVVVGWTGVASGYGANGVGGVGASVLWGSLALSALVFLGLWCHGVLRADRRAVVEMTLHLYTLCMTPVSQALLQAVFLSLGFTWEEAFLSGAVLAPPLNLSCSFYYTVYANRSGHWVHLSYAHSPSKGALGFA
jgi:hypothetical protein